MTRLAALVQSGADLHEINDVFPELVLQHKRKIEEYMAFNSLAFQDSALLPWADLLYSGPDENTRSIVSWVNSNLHCSARPIKAPQLFIVGPSNTGKTSFAQFLSTRVRTYPMPFENFFDGFDDQFDLAIADEFYNTNIDARALNAFLDGQAMRLRTKGGSVLKRRNIPVIILSNYSASSLFGLNSTQTKVFSSRVVTIDLTNPIDLAGLSFAPLEGVPSSAPSL